MDKREAVLKIQRMSIAEKIAMLCETEEAYVRNLIEGAVQDGQKQRRSRQAAALPAIKKAQ